MKEDEALIWKRLCSALPFIPSLPHHFPIQWDKQVACSISIHPLHFHMEEQAWASAPPLSILYLRFTERSLGTHHTKISTCSLIAQQGGNTIARELHIVLTDRQPGTERAAETNKLITHGREGCRGGLVQVLLSLIVCFLAIKTWAHSRVAPPRLIKDALVYLKVSSHAGSFRFVSRLRPKTMEVSGI